MVSTSRIGEPTLGPVVDPVPDSVCFYSGGLSPCLFPPSVASERRLLSRREETLSAAGGDTLAVLFLSLASRELPLLFP